jgi:hypothetical protein
MTARWLTLLMMMALFAVPAQADEDPTDGTPATRDDDDSATAADDDDSAAAADDDDSAAAADDDDSATAADDDDSAPVGLTAPPGLMEAAAVAEGKAPSIVPVPAPTGLTVTAPEYNSGLNLELTWTPNPDVVAAKFTVARATSPDGPWEMRKEDLTSEATSYSDKLADDPLNDGLPDVFYYRVLALPAGLRAQADEANLEEIADRFAFFDAHANSSAIVSAEPKPVWLNTSLGFALMALIILATGGLIFWFTEQVRSGKEIYIRRIPGIDAIEEGIGRATEMGKPVLYVPGIDELQDIQTIASMLILGEVSKMIAEYQCELIVACCVPMVREVAEEVVRAGYYQAGYPDAYNPLNTRFISSEQFAFCAGTNGIILREKPATNIYLGRFFAESLILAETGFINKSIQIAGTAEATQLPFFIAACDYTLIGEELFAVSAYLSKDPRLVSSLKASDWIKVFCVSCILLGTVMSSFGVDWMVTLFTAVGN